MIDTTKPIEAVHKETRKTFPVTFANRIAWSDGFQTNECPDPSRTNREWRSDGTDYCSYNEWFVRNVPEAPPASPKPATIVKPRQCGKTATTRTVNKLTPLARTILDYLQSKGDASPLEATLDLGVNSGSFTRRITELRRAGYPITDENRKHPITGRQYKRYFYRLDS